MRQWPRLRGTLGEAIHSCTRTGDQHTVYLGPGPTQDLPHVHHGHSASTATPSGHPTAWHPRAGLMPHHTQNPRRADREATGTS